MSVRERIQRAGLLWLVGMAGVVVLLHGARIPPSIIQRTHLSERTLLIISAVNNGALIAVAVAIGALVAHRVGLVSLIAHTGVNAVRWISGLPLYLVLGVLAGAAITLADTAFTKAVPALSAFNKANAGALKALDLGLWQRILYGGVTEEIVLRWGAMSLIVWICVKLVRNHAAALTIGIVLSALLFAFGHLPALAQLVHHIPRPVIVRVVALNFVMGVAFGIVYARNSLEAAMVTHAGLHLGVLGVRALLGA
jgi:hypothetical protein